MCFLKIGREKVKVTKEVYDFYRRSHWNEKAAERKNAKYSDSLDRTLFNRKDETFSLYDVIGSSEKTPEEICIQRDKSEAIKKTLAELSELERQCIRLSFEEGRSDEYCAQIFGIPKTTYNYRKRRVQEKFKETFQKYF